MKLNELLARLHVLEQDGHGKDQVHFEYTGREGPGYFGRVTTITTERDVISLSDENMPEEQS